MFGAGVATGSFVYFNTPRPEESPSRDVVGAIRDKWAALGMDKSALGQAVAEERPTYDGIGRSQQFQGGIISWHPETGAHVVWGKIGERWLELGREQFGYPTTDEIVRPDGRGRAGDFRAVQLPGKPIASIYWTPETGAHEVFGAIRDKWTEMGAERSTLGYPVSPEQERGDGRIQRFQGGSLFWTPQAGVVPQ